MVVSKNKYESSKKMITQSVKMRQAKNEMPRRRGAFEIYDDQDNIVKRIFDEPS